MAIRYAAHSLNPAEDRGLTFSTDTRTIGFRPDDSLITYIRNKNETTKVNLSIQYSQGDTRFDDRMFQAKAKESIQQIVASAGRAEGLLVDVKFESR